MKHQIYVVYYTQWTEEGIDPSFQDKIIKAGGKNYWTDDGTDGVTSWVQFTYPDTYWLLFYLIALANLSRTLKNDKQIDITVIWDSNSKYPINIHGDPGWMIEYIKRGKIKRR